MIHRSCAAGIAACLLLATAILAQKEDARAPVREALDGGSPLYRAARLGDIAGVAALLSDGAKPDATVARWAGDAGWTPLMIAAAEGHTAVAQTLLESGSPVDQRNARGRTALLFAAWYNHSDTAAVLLDAGADPEAADVLGQTPLSLAHLKSASDMIHLLESKVRRRSP